MDVRPVEGARSHPPITSVRLPGSARLGTSSVLHVDEQVAREAALSPPRLLRANADLVDEGASADSLFIVLEGWAFRYTTTREGGRQILALLLPGDVANLDSLLLDRLDYGVRTITDAQVAMLPCNRALALAAQHPDVGRTFTRAALIEKAALSKWMLSVARQPSKERLAHLLCELSARLGAEHDNESHFALPITQELLGDALGLTSVHVNRTMQQLRAEELIRYDRRSMSLPDIAALRRACGFDPGYLHMASPDRRHAT